MLSNLVRRFRRQRVVPQNSPVLDLTVAGIEPFSGFAFTVAEGQALAQRCYTELPEFFEPSASPTKPVTP